MLNGLGQELPVFLGNSYQSTFQVRGSQQKQRKMFQESQKGEKNVCTELVWIPVVDSSLCNWWTVQTSGQIQRVQETFNFYQSTF